MLKKLKSFLKNKGIVDAFVFGSAAKGKSTPNDTDICLLFREKIDLDLVREIGEKFEGLHISSLVVDNFFTKPHALARTLLFEGKSIISGKRLSETYGLSSFALYTYDISNMKSSDKVRFVYLLKGRNDDNGVVKRLGGNFVSNATFMLPPSKDSEMQEIMEKWKVKYERKQAMLIS